MKSLIGLAFLIMSSVSMAQTFKFYDVVKDVEAFSSLNGKGSYSEYGVNKTKNNNCYIYNENIDIWSSDYVVTGDFTEIVVGPYKLSTDLQTWSAKDSTVTKVNGVKTYTHKYVSVRNCNVTEKLVITPKKSVEFEETILCSDRRMKSGMKKAICRF